MKAYMDTYYKCGGEDDDAELTVGPDPHGFGCVRLFAATEQDKANWDDLDLLMPPALARKIGEALLLAADEVENVNVAK